MEKKTERMIMIYSLEQNFVLYTFLFLFFDRMELMNKIRREWLNIVESVNVLIPIIDLIEDDTVTANKYNNQNIQ